MLPDVTQRVREVAAATVVLSLICLAGRVAEALPRSAAQQLPAIVAFGDSLTAGPGIEPDQAYPARLHRKLEENGYKFRVVNAGVSGDTSTRALERLDTALVPETRILILALGINDGLRGVPVATVERNLTAIVERARSRQVAVLLCAMEAPPVHGFGYTVEFHRMFVRVASRFELPLVPFFLYNVAGDPSLNLPDRVHPNADGHKLIADAIWPHLEPMVARISE